MMEGKIMRLSRSASLLVATALVLGACGPVNRGLESANQPVVQRTDYVYDVNGQGGLSHAEQGKLTAWFDALNLRYGDRVSIDDRSNDSATHNDIAALVARYGLLLSETAPVTDGSNVVAGARVVVSRSTANVPNCPNWDRSSQPELAGSTMSNFGCAINSNLAAMIANPADLIQGQSGTGTDTRMIARAIKTYRDKIPTGQGELKEVKASGGGN